MERWALGRPPKAGAAIYCVQYSAMHVPAAALVRHHQIVTSFLIGGCGQGWQDFAICLCKLM
jgi:hypothetical protein